MSMIFGMVSLTPGQIAALQATPALASDLMYADQEEGSELQIPGLGNVEAPLDLYKSWHILHYLFTGDVGPVGSPGDALLAGDDLGGDISGYGPPRLLDPEATKHFADFLHELDASTLQGRADYRRMSAAGVYSLPMGPDAEAEFELGIRSEIGSYFPLLRTYVIAAASKGNGLLMWLT